MPTNVRPIFDAHLDLAWCAVSYNRDLTQSMEGTDPIVTPSQAREWWDVGLRAAGLTHYGVGRHGYGTAVEGPLSDEGVALLKEFEKLGMILDVTHLCDQSMAQALDLFGGR